MATLTANNSTLIWHWLPVEKYDDLCDHDDVELQPFQVTVWNLKQQIEFRFDGNVYPVRYNNAHEILQRLTGEFSALSRDWKIDMVFEGNDWRIESKDKENRSYTDTSTDEARKQFLLSLKHELDDMQRSYAASQAPARQPDDTMYVRV